MGGQISKYLLYFIGRIKPLYRFDVPNKPQHCSLNLHLSQTARYICFQLEIE